MYSSRCTITRGSKVEHGAAVGPYPLGHQPLSEEQGDTQRKPRDDDALIKKKTSPYQRSIIKTDIQAQNSFLLFYILN